MKLNFYIDPAHYPYSYRNELNLGNKKLLTELGTANTWLLWTLRTYLELRDIFNCELTDKIPETGIMLFFRGSVNLTQKPRRGQFWVCMVADSTWHPYSHINIFQNNAAVNGYPNAFFMRHWQQLGMIASVSANKRPVRIFYFGDVENLAPELKTEDWQKFISDNGFCFETPHSSQWHNYKDADVVLGIRSFTAGENYINKPSSKLINAWRARTIFIGGNETAYHLERVEEFDFISVHTYDELKHALLKLKTEPESFRRYRLQAAQCAERFPDRFFKQQWIDLINNSVLPHYQSARSWSLIRYSFFITSRFFKYKLAAVARRLKKRRTALSSNKF